MRTIVLLFILHALVAQAQPGLEETQVWIAEKISAFGYGNGKISNNYTVTFEGDQFVVHETTFNPLTGREECDYSIHWNDIAYLSTTRYDETIWFNIVLKSLDHSGSFCFSKMQDKKVSMIFRKAFEQEDLPNRMRKAVSRWVELKGGKALPSGEPY